MLAHCAQRATLDFVNFFERIVSEEFVEPADAICQVLPTPLPLALAIIRSLLALQSMNEADTAGRSLKDNLRNLQRIQVRPFLNSKRF